MATFFNQATLSYNNETVNSNIVSAELVEGLRVTKNAVSGNYAPGSNVTYVISLVNSGTADDNGLTVTDDLGGYALPGGGTAYPLTYQPDSILYYVNGVLQPTPTVTSTQPLTVTGINVPAGGNAAIVYDSAVNGFAPLDAGAEIINTASVNGAALASEITAPDTITVDNAPRLSITKSVSPDVITENDQLTYTFVIGNTGNTNADGDIIVSDTFDPVLRGVTVTYNGTPWVEGTNYTYDETTGVFTTLPGQITVDAGNAARNADTGLTTVTPGVASIRVTGTV